MDTYSIEWKPSAIHELRRIDRKMIARIVAAIEDLKDNPLPAGVRKLQGSLMTYRVRVGDYRIVYEIIGAQLIIQIVRVRHRREAYR